MIRQARPRKTICVEVIGVLRTTDPGGRLASSIDAYEAVVRNVCTPRTISVPMNTLVGEKDEELKELCRRFLVRKLELLGSGVPDAFDPEKSDLDFLVEFDAVPASQHARCYFG